MKIPTSEKMKNDFGKIMRTTAQENGPLNDSLNERLEGSIITAK